MSTARDAQQLELDQRCTACLAGAHRACTRRSCGCADEAHEHPADPVSAPTDSGAPIPASCAAEEGSWQTAIDVWVPGKPAPQGSTKAFVNPRTGRAIVTKDNKITQRTWRGDVRETVLGELPDGWLPIDGPVRLVIDFVMPRPVSTPKRRTPPAVKKPDGDKLQRAVWDALTSAGVYRDDSQVVAWGGGKRLAELDETSGARIRVQTPDPTASGSVLDGAA